jgi:pimeloyl-ACP methyl ester carboxylesterase
LVVGGLSLGAATALLWALKRPHAVAGLVLAAYPESTGAMRDWALDFASQIERDGIDKAGFQFIWGPDGRFEMKDSRQIRRGILEHPPAALVAILRQAMAQIPEISTLRQELEQFRVPILLVVGDRDGRSIAVSRLIADAAPNARLAIIEDAGHVVNLSQPATFNQELARFIGDL